MSHEFHLLADVGEDQLKLCTNCDFSANAEIVPSDVCPRCRGQLEQSPGIEVSLFYISLMHHDG